MPADDGDELVAALVELEAGAERSAVRAALGTAFDRMGTARPDLLMFGRVPLSGRSRKPDRKAAAELVASTRTGDIELVGGARAGAAR